MRKINRAMQLQGDIKDRGNIKWTSLFLPEHVKAMREWQEDIGKVDKPLLDEFDLQVLQEELEIAIQTANEVRIKEWKDGKFVYHRGIITRANSQKLTYEDPFGKHDIYATNLIEIMSLY
ncbi:YolD-like family protein [Paenisporosarcina cavernae]|uniref:YolD-like family protein n=1 Tax=Paenisporosarcina cavernae TaxID=2320858 RepID=A0A385YQ38_9BACL|nr:YolD-like family protein [Paenisporosarcina cavernae]AYC28736.1 YolD-like family protein [Paenisporosarcina cavernae]